jgi:hypothetical protein
MMKGDLVLLSLAVILIVVWALGWFAFHAAGALLHLLLIVGIVSLAVHVVRGRRAGA